MTRSVSPWAAAGSALLLALAALCGGWGGGGVRRPDHRHVTREAVDPVPARERLPREGGDEDGTGSRCFNREGTEGPCGPGFEMCGKPYVGVPRYHIMDESCGENDPNGPFYDEVHGMYHHFYQDHLGMAPGHGPVYGHAVSRDLVHWAHLPVAIWNDEPYDNVAIFTGSASIVNGSVVQIYPGLCTDKSWPGCRTGVLLAAAVPADASDPFYTRWRKLGVIVNNTQRDPSTAWQEPSGEWRITTYDAMVYGSMDFKTWYTVGKQKGFPVAECPSLFTLPRATKGAGPAPANAPTYTHVHKHSGGGQDQMTIGTYQAGSPGQPGTWTGGHAQWIDRGVLYASKDLWDPVKKRRINYGWARVHLGAQTLPREVTFNPELQQLVFSPLEEQDQLREAQLSDVGRTELGAGKDMHLGPWPDSAGNQSEIEAVFEMPQQATRLGLAVMAGAKSNGTVFFIDFKPREESATAAGIWTVQVGVMPAHRFFDAQSDGADDGTERPDELRRQIFRRRLEEEGSPEVGTVKDTLQLSPNDKTLSLRVYVDNTFAEAFWQGGRVAMTIATPSTPEAAAAVMATQPATLQSVKAWHVGSIWVSPEEVLRTPRPPRVEDTSPAQ